MRLSRRGSALTGGERSRLAGGSGASGAAQAGGSAGGRTGASRPLLDVGGVHPLRAIDRLEDTMAAAETVEAAVVAYVGRESATAMTRGLSRALGKTHDARIPRLDAMARADSAAAGTLVKNTRRALCDAARP